MYHLTILLCIAKVRQRYTLMPLVRENITFFISEEKTIRALFGMFTVAFIEYKKIYIPKHIIECEHVVVAFFKKEAVLAIYLQQQ